MPAPVNRLLPITLFLALLVGCAQAPSAPSYDVRVNVDGEERLYSLSRALTVDQLLEYAGIELEALDRISHPLVAQIADGMLITIRRVREEEVCERQEVAYERLLLPKEGLPIGGRQLGQAGAPGLTEACYRVVFEDGEEARRDLIDQPLIIREPVAEIMYTGLDQSVAALEIAGRLSYINHSNAWTVAGNTSKKTALTAGKQLDSLVFHQNGAGNLLLFTSETDPTDDFFNELWMAATDGSAAPQRLAPSDVLYAEWRPRSSNTLAYSTGEPSPGDPAWKALNNLWLMRVDLESGRALTIEEALPESSGGFYGYWGTHFAWSPLGDQMAWARPDGFGLVDFERRRNLSLADYAVFHSARTWVWITSLSWSFDGKLLASTMHGLPLGNEPAETSPIFNIAVTSADGRFSAPLRLETGMWASPRFSPRLPTATGDSEGYLAWLQARAPRNSMSGEYDLMIADRDGSNRRLLFPPPGEPGIQKRDAGLTPKDFAWSPDARHIALTYLGDIWLVNIEAGSSTQLTFDGGSSNPVWTG